MPQTFGLRAPEPPTPPISQIERLRKHASEAQTSTPHAEPAISPKAEAERLNALDGYDILDTPPEEAFDRIIRLTKKLLGTPVAIVSFIDGHRQWHKAGEGMGNAERPRSGALCAKVVENGEPLIILDAANDPRFAQSPYVAGPPFIRFYAGVPLRTPDEKIIGSLCAIDTAPRELDTGQLDLLTDLAQIVMDELELRLQAKEDRLTGSLSRRAFKERAAQAVALSFRHHDGLSCIALDLDHFQAVNDAHGVRVGDQVLARTIMTVRKEIRESDLVGRLGGEEFAVLLPQTDKGGAVEVAERMRAAIEQMAIALGSKTIQVTASFGVAALGRPTPDAETLLQHAGQALAQAKEQGRNKVAAWERPDDAAAPNRRRVLKGGRILFNDHNSTLDCTVRSLSEDGAGLDVSSSSGVPRNFDLEIKADDLLKPCRVVAQTEKHIDVEFY